ncbi:hypothetical protein Salat_0685500 [Sesamum alatum]|uniref:Uncharacterized protein n=1 Tax=Sesamum alatum TaxID=300844 RepID=A0AAE1YS92_9LAMI|nr:hypothetical protein Salat_0685500 [Sesamum alatum]
MVDGGGDGRRGWGGGSLGRGSPRRFDRGASIFDFERGVTGGEGGFVERSGGEARVVHLRGVDVGRKLPATGDDGSWKEGVAGFVTEYVEHAPAPRRFILVGLAGFGLVGGNSDIGRDEAHQFYILSGQGRTGRLDSEHKRLQRLKVASLWLTLRGKVEGNDGVQGVGLRASFQFLSFSRGGSRGSRTGKCPRGSSWWIEEGFFSKLGVAENSARQSAP